MTLKGHLRSSFEFQEQWSEWAEVAIISWLNFHPLCKLFDQKLSFSKSRDKVTLSYFV